MRGATQRMSTPEAPKSVSLAKRLIGYAGVLATISAVIGGIALAFFALHLFVDVLIPSIFQQIGAATPGVLRDFLLWLATDKTVAEINDFASEWSGLLTLLGIALAVVFFVLSLPDRSSGKSSGGGKD